MGRCELLCAERGGDEVTQRIVEEVLYYTILYYTILYCTILYYTILYYTILYYTILYFQYYTYYTILYYAILCYTVLYNTILTCVCMYAPTHPTHTWKYAHSYQCTQTHVILSLSFLLSLSLAVISGVRSTTHT